MTGDKALEQIRSELRERERLLIEECACGYVQRRYLKAVGALKEVRRSLTMVQGIIQKFNGGEEDAESDSAED